MNMKKAELLLANRDFAGARKLLRGLLLRSKVNKDAMYLLSIAEAELGNVEEALNLLSRVIAMDSQHAAAHYTKANLLIGLDRHFDALLHHDRAVKLLASTPWVFINRGISRAALKNYAGAIDDFDTAIGLDPTLSAAFGNKGNALLETNLFEQSLQFLDKAIELDPFNVDALSSKSVCLKKLKKSEEALIYAERSIELKPDYAEAWSNRGNALHDLQHYEEALASYERSIELKPDYAEAWSNRGNALGDLRRHEEALASCERSIELKPDYAEAWGNRGVALHDLRRFDEAMASYDKAIAIDPNNAEAWSNRGIALNDLRRHEEAMASYERSIELKPDADYVLGDLVHTQMKICDWTDLEARCQTLEQRLLKEGRAITPFVVLGLFDNPQLQRHCAEIYANDKLGLESSLGPVAKRDKGDKIRVGYFSMDFCEHPVSHLIADLIECHDRSKFEIYGFSFGANTGDPIRKRLESAFDKFLEVRSLSDGDIARLARDHEIDIAIDLGGYTHNSRPAIFAHRAAPIQINYLGYPGTMGSTHWDYFIGDRVTVSDDNLEHFSEKVIFLPNSFQANPSQRPFGAEASSRTAYGLPERGFVFCCMNNTWKLTPECLIRWARILRGVPASVLWVYVDATPARHRLEEAFEQLGVDSNRLVFSNRVTREVYFEQYQFADLFLDTFPYNAGTTASDALWMGLPVLTLAGRSFAGRMAASLLQAVGLPELITHTAEDYESLAIELANNPEKMAALKAKLAENRPSHPLFNTPLFARHIESAYRAAYDRYHAGLAPDHIYVSS